MIHGTVVGIKMTHGQIDIAVKSNRKVFHSSNNTHPSVLVGQRVYIKGQKDFEIVRVF